MTANDFFVAMGIIFVMAIGVAVCAGMWWSIMCVLELKEKLEGYSREVDRQYTRIRAIEIKLKGGEKND